MTKKTCFLCKETLPLELFYKKPKGLHGRDSRCKQCVLKLKKSQYKKINCKTYALEGGVDIEIQEEVVMLYWNALNEH